MMAGVELDRCASGHEVSHQQSVNQLNPAIPQHKPVYRLGKTGRYLQLRSFTIFALHDLYSGPF